MNIDMKKVSIFGGVALLFLVIFTLGQNLTAKVISNPSVEDYTSCDEFMCYIEDTNKRGELTRVYAYYVGSNGSRSGGGADLVYTDRYAKSGGEVYLKLRKEYVSYEGRIYMESQKKYLPSGELKTVKFYEKVPFEDELYTFDGKLLKKNIYDEDNGNLLFVNTYDLDSGNLIKRAQLNSRGDISYLRVYDSEGHLELDYSSPKFFIDYSFGDGYLGEPQTGGLEQYFQNRFNSINSQIQDHGQNVDLVFYGDSITDNLNFVPSNVVFEEYYGNYSTLNAGVGGDTAYNLLWRLNNGNADNIDPKLIVLNIGTNDVGIASLPSSTAIKNVESVIFDLRSRFPNSKILITGPLPRGEYIFDPKRVAVSEINENIKYLDYEDNIYYVNLENLFVLENGNLDLGLMPDELHPNEEGQRLIAEALKGTISSLMA